MHKYRLEFILSIQDASPQIIRNAIVGFGEGLEISPLPQDNGGKTRDLKIHILTEDPTVIFDTCAQFGRIKSVKVDEV